jgi:beta-phosphoglucomutase-like phosphatase (HAD superfamily)
MLGVEPSNCLVFEDALGGIEAARRAEMDVFAILTTLHRHEVTGTANLISAGPDFTHFDLLAVAG